MSKKKPQTSTLKILRNRVLAGLFVVLPLYITFAVIRWLYDVLNKDETTGQDILYVYVPTTPVPTSGYMLLVPESNVVALDWDLQETLQAIVSGGITTPPVVRYYADASQQKNLDSSDKKKS